MKSSLTVIIPAYNEANDLKFAYESTLRALAKAGICDYEIFLMTVVGPDGKHDSTPQIARQIAENDCRVKNFHSPFFTSLGFKYREGVYAATKEYVAMVPAHNLTSENSLNDIFRHIGTTDSVLTYTLNPEVRPLKARIISKCFVALCNLMFGLRVKYFNGITIHRRKLLQMIPMSANNHAYMAEIIVYLIKSGVPYIEIPQILKESTRAGKAFNIKSAFNSFLTLISLFWKIRVQGIRVKIT
jgi:dolichol-phosphate mannosyltransferase